MMRRRRSRGSQTFCNFRIGGILATSTSGSSEDHKMGSDSLYADDLSDSVTASPYEKPVSFKDEVHLFSPRDSPAKGSVFMRTLDSQVSNHPKSLPTHIG